jgi:mRNA interferase RelE/StbE
MSYELRFKEEALAEWRRLDGSVRAQFKAKLAERLDHPRMPAAPAPTLALARIRV